MRLLNKKLQKSIFSSCGNSEKARVLDNSVISKIEKKTQLIEYLKKYTHEAE